MATEKRLIDANKLKKAILAEPWKEQINAVRLTVDYINIIIDEQPTADATVQAQLVVGMDGSYMCSACNKVYRYGIGNYCSQCGAKLGVDYIG